MKFVNLIIVSILTITFLFPEEGVAIKNETDLENIKKNAPKLFIDCQSCDLDHIRTNISFVNYVTEVKEAHIYLLITSLRTGSGGQEYTLEFTGYREFKGINDKLRYISHQNDTDDEVREGIVKILKLGLVSYLKNSDLAKYIDITFTKKLDPTKTTDKWNSWVFNLDFSGWLNGEELFNSKNLRYSASADRVTPQSRVRLKIYSSKYDSSYIIDEEEIKSISKTSFAQGLYVASLNDHWSIGGFVNVFSSTYRNTDVEYRLSPTIEYNVFPYSEATKKQFRFQYKLGFKKTMYNEETIYGKMAESLFFQELSVALELKQKWGSISTSLSWFSYLHDFSKYSAMINSRISWRIFKGFSFDMSGGYSLIHNQLYLPKGELSSEEIFLRVSALKTSFDYWVSAGIRFTFGSVYNNVVNPRFGY